MSRYAAVVCDLDGVVYRGPTAVPHAVEALRALDVPVLYATNNASRAPGDVAAHLRELGLPCAPELVATSSQAGAWLMTQRMPAGTSVLAVGGPGVATALEEAGLTVLRPDAGAGHTVSAVLQGYGPSVTASDLAEAAYAVQAGATWVATNTDATLPTDRGMAPGNGSLVAAVERAVGRGPDVVAGKPAPPLYLLCAERLDIPAGRVLAVGDRLDTDIEGAVAAGMDSLFVLTGVDDLYACLEAPASRRPTWVAPDLRALATDPDAGPASLVRLAAAVRAVHAARDAGAPSSELARLTERVQSLLGDVTPG
ncbi:HAD-IIA family hydrolase [Fodinibacter luteus]|uniref:HAD-IIA family hydrolase n=1 Tax=Fodinibacter luteus TaxID=552064 RepID=UPI0031E65738